MPELSQKSHTLHHRKNRTRVRVRVEHDGGRWPRWEWYSRRRREILLTTASVAGVVLLWVVMSAGGVR